MAPGSAALALKVAAVVAVLAMLVLPSLGRCRSPAPPPRSPPPPTSTPSPPPPPPALTPPPPAVLLPPTPAPTPAPGPGLGPVIPCHECSYQCCYAFVTLKCSGECNAVERSCNSCRTQVSALCRADINCTGSCDECNDPINNSCISACTTRYCDACMRGRSGECRHNCSEQCSPPNCISWSPQN